MEHLSYRGMSFLFSVDISPCVAFPAVVSQLFALRHHR